jgi:hypothetical protein
MSTGEQSDMKQIEVVSIIILDEQKCNFATQWEGIRRYKGL